MAVACPTITKSGDTRLLLPTYQMGICKVITVPFDGAVVMVMVPCNRAALLCMFLRPLPLSDVDWLTISISGLKPTPLSVTCKISWSLVTETWACNAVAPEYLMALLTASLKMR